MFLAMKLIPKGEIFALWHRGYKTFFSLRKKLNMKFIALINIKISKHVGISILISMVNFMLSSVLQGKC